LAGTSAWLDRHPRRSPPVATTPDKGLAEIIIGKQRKGPTGSIKLKLFGEYTYLRQPRS